MVYYNTIFFTNVLQQMHTRKIKTKDLAEKSGVSISFLSDLTTGKGNPSLKVMEKIASALDVPLSFLLESNDLNAVSLNVLREGRGKAFNLPDDHEIVVAVLPAHKAFQVKKWSEETRKKLQSKK